MDPLPDGLPNPWLPYVVLGAALIVTLGTVVPQLRLLGPGVRRLWQLRGRDGPMLLLASSAGVTSIVGAALAVEAAGPGALVWLWIATLLGMSLHFAEAAARAKSEVAPAIADRLGGLGKPLAALVCLAFIGAAATVGGMMQTHQAAAVLRGFTDVSAWAVAIPMAVLGLAGAWSSKLRRVLVVFCVPAAIVVWVALCVIAFTEDPLLLGLRLGDVFNQAFGLKGVAAGTTTGIAVVAVHHGVLRAVMGTGIGLGTASLAPPADDEGSQSSPGAAAMLVPLLSALLLSTTTGLAMLTETAQTEPIVEGSITPMERPYSRGLRPSQQVGQTVVLPEDAPMKPGEHYGMQLRANPRGHAFARLLADENAVLLPAWEVAEGIDTVVFRSRDTERSDEPAWDVRISVNAELIEGKGGPDYLRLTPTDPDLDLGKLAARYELNSKPFVVLSDFSFPGRVGQARSPDPALGDHLAMFEPELADRPFNPKFHEFFRGGYRGPYPDEEGPRPPWGWVAGEGFVQEVGTIVPVELQADPRGVDLARVNRSGGVEAPPWDFLLDTRALVLRHQDDPSKDILLEVTPKLDGFRVRFEPTDPKWSDLRKVDSMPEYTGPFVLTGDQRYELEVHSDTRLADEYRGRRALVPRHPHSEPMGPVGALPYRPHPAELLDAGFTGPFIVRDGGAAVGHRMHGSPSDEGSDEGSGSGSGPGSGPGSGRGWIAGLAAIVLGVGALAAWSVCARAGVTFLVGPRLSFLGPIIVAAAAAVGAGMMTLPSLLAWTDTAMALVLVPNLLAVALTFQWGRGAKGAAPPPDPTDPAQPSTPPTGSASGERKRAAASDDAR